MSEPDPALSKMARSFETTADLIKKSVALLADSAALLQRNGPNIDLTAICAGRLLMAERHVAEGEQRVRRQQELVAELERDGHDVRDAKLLLRQFEEIHDLQIVHLNALRDVANADASRSAG